MLFRSRTLSDKVFNWKFKNSVRFNRTYDKFFDVAERFEDLVDRGFRQIALADAGR